MDDKASWFVEYNYVLILKKYVQRKLAPGTVVIGGGMDNK